MKNTTYRLMLLAILSLLLCNAFGQAVYRLTEGWQFVKKDLGSVWEAVRPILKDDHPENYPAWNNISLPHCVNAKDAVDPDQVYYQGGVWYRIQLSIDNPYPQGRTFLHFEGAGQKTDVYVYNTKVYSHTGGYDEWKVDITDAVHAFQQQAVYTKQFQGKVPVVVRCSNERDPEMIPSNLSDFNLYGGLYRAVNLVYAPALSVDKLMATATVDANGKKGLLTVKAKLYNPQGYKQAKAVLSLTAPDGKVITKDALVHIDSNFISLQSIQLNMPKLWQPDTPRLYTVVLKLYNNNQVSTYTTQVGFRHTAFLVKGPFMLNGKRLLLRGTQRHEDHAGAGAAMTDAQIRQELLLIKQMGANFIRLGHFQQSKLVLDLCDSLGLLVWEEIPWCRGGLGGYAYQQQAKQMLTNLIEQHYNHPSVIVWGLGNENDWPNDFPVFDKDSIRSFMQQLNVLAHELDSTRKTVIRRCDFCNDIPDVYSPSLWRGWYKGFYTEYYQGTWEEVNKVKHFLHAEWGGDSHAGRHSEKIMSLLQDASMDKDSTYFNQAARLSKNGDWSETYICDLMDWTLKEQERMPWLTGAAQWIFKDFATPIRPDNPLPYINQKGLVQRDLTPKESYYVFQSYWAHKPMVHIYGHTWPIRWGKEQESKLVKVYSNCDEVELWLNGKSMGIKKRNSTDFPAAGLRWNVIFQKGKNELRAMARKTDILIADTINVLYQTEVWQKPARMVLQKLQEKDSVVTIRVQLTDTNGIPCLDATNVVRFGITGDGRLLDNMGTATGSRQLQVSNGTAIIDVDVRKGASVVSVQSAGLPTAFLNL